MTDLSFCVAGDIGINWRSANDGDLVSKVEVGSPDVLRGEHAEVVPYRSA